MGGQTSSLLEIQAANAFLPSDPSFPRGRPTGKVTARARERETQAVLGHLSRASRAESVKTNSAADGDAALDLSGVMVDKPRLGRLMPAIALARAAEGAADVRAGGLRAARRWGGGGLPQGCCGRQAGGFGEVQYGRLRFVSWHQ